MRANPPILTKAGEEGYLLVGAIVAIFLILLAISVAAPTMAKELKRDREIETEHRANQYVRAIQLYYRKFGHYPGSIEQLKNSNNQKFLRQEYADPFTGKADWRLIHVGEAKTTVKGFFGQPLAGLPTGNLGSAAGLSSGIGTPTAGSSFGGSSTSSGSTSAFGGTTTPSTGTGTTGASGTTGTGPNSSTGGSGIASQSATSFQGGGAPIMGIGLMKAGDAILVVNEQTDYQDWEFLYDPRIEQLKAKANLLGGGPPSTSLSGLGTASSLNGSSTSGSSGSTTSPTGTTPSSGTTSGSSTPPQ